MAFQLFHVQHTLSYDSFQHTEEKTCIYNIWLHHLYYLRGFIETTPAGGGAGKPLSCKKGSVAVEYS